MSKGLRTAGTHRPDSQSKGWIFRDAPIWGSVGASLFGQATLILSGPLTARLLGVTGRGELALLTVVAVVGSQLGGAGLPTAVAYSIATHHTSARAVLRVIATTWIGLCIGAGVLSGAAVLVLPSYSESQLWLAALVAVLVVSLMTWALILACLQGERRFGWLNSLRPLYSTASAACILALFIVGRGATVTTVLSILVSVSVATCVVGAVAVRAGRDAATVPPPTLTRRALVNYGLASVAGGTLPLDSLSLDQAAVGILLSRHDLGLYAVGSAFNNLPSTLLSGIGTIALPRVASEKDELARQQTVRRTVAASIFVAALLTVVVELLVPTVLPLAFGQQFAAAVPAARILIIAGFFLSFRRILVVFLQASGRPGQTGVGEAVGLGTLGVLAAILVPRFGLIGASFALVGAAIAANAYLIVVLRSRPFHTVIASD